MSGTYFRGEAKVWCVLGVGLLYCTPHSKPPSWSRDFPTVLSNFIISKGRGPSNVHMVHCSRVWCSLFRLFQWLLMSTRFVIPSVRCSRETHCNSSRFNVSEVRNSHGSIWRSRSLKHRRNFETCYLRNIKALGTSNPGKIDTVPPDLKGLV